MDDDSSAHMNPQARSPVLVVAHTPGIPARYEVLLKNISCLLSWENRGKSYQCSSNQKNEFLSWSKAEKFLFFEWEEEEEQMLCWMHDIPRNSHIKFLVNPAIKHGTNDAPVKHPALAFSSGFGDDSWAIVKTMLSTIFGSSEEKDSVEHDYMYVFTRIGSSFCIRNFKIDAVPKGEGHESPFVLTEVYPFCCLKLLDAEGTLNQVPDMPQIQLSRIFFYSVPSDSPGSFTPHSVKLKNGTYPILLKNDCNLSLALEYDGFNVSLDHLLSKEPALKIKPIIGSRTNKQSVFVRNRFKFILQSIVLQLQHLFAAKKCLDTEMGIGIAASNVLIKGTDVKFYGLKITGYTDQLANSNLLWLVKLIHACFPPGMTPIEVRDALERLGKSEKDHLDSLEELKNDCLWLRAAERRTLLITHHSEYMTNFHSKEEHTLDVTDETDVGDRALFFENCPYIDDWQQLATDNEYLMDVSDMPEDAIEGSVGAAERGSVEGAIEDDVLEDTIGGSVEGATEGVVEDAVTKRAQKKLKMINRIKSVQKRQKRRKFFPHKGKKQFDAMRNFGMHMPERAKKDGICPFRLGLPDYITTGYYPSYLGFIHMKMASLLRKQKLKKKVNQRQ